MPKPRIVASIEARMSSSRLPGKVLMEINGRPAMLRLVDRLRQCRYLDDVIVATTTSESDDVLVAWCEDNRVPCYRGSEEDVLDRVVEAQKFMKSDLVVEITGDSPLTDPEIVDMGIETFLAHDADVVSNCGRTMSWPMGQNVQVFPLRLLEEINRTIGDATVHEHVSLYFYEHPERYRLIELIAPRRWREPGWRMQLDYSEDLKFLNEVYARLEPVHGEGFGLEEVMALLRREPALVAINLHCKEKATRE
jgi:spore coat polysaccharide biosynthesis protein SpsF